MPDKPLTDPHKKYNLRQIISGVDWKHTMMRGWNGTRRNGKPFVKQWRKGASEYPGGPAMDMFLERNPEYIAYEIHSDEPIQAVKS